MVHTVHRSALSPRWIAIAFLKADSKTLLLIYALERAHAFVLLVRIALPSLKIVKVMTACIAVIQAVNANVRAVIAGTLTQKISGS